MSDVNDVVRGASRMPPALDVREAQEREPRSERSLAELVSEMGSELSTLLRKEVELAKVEAKEEASKAGKAAGLLGGAAVAAHMALLFVSLALAWLLDEVMHTAIAFLIVGVLYGIGAAILAKTGQTKLKTVQAVPQTTETLKEDARWARAPKS